jgi:hypothetical protein
LNKKTVAVSPRNLKLPRNKAQGELGPAVMEGQDIAYMLCAMRATK